MRELTRSAAVVASLILLGTASGISINEPSEAEQQGTYDAVIVLLATATDTSSRWEHKSRHRDHHGQTWAAHEGSRDQSNPEIGVDATASEAGAGVHAVIRSRARTGSDVVLRSLPGVDSGKASCS